MLELEPRNVKALYRLSLAHSQDNKPDDAWPHIKLAKSLQPKDKAIVKLYHEVNSK